mmetsp:Transcript_30895/g.75524  ORF Transcript_30895/g.75524 Transcript_30895/m.75524 type:complete len:328 (-) Transcript_30895:153-1136(-)
MSPPRAASCSAASRPLPPPSSTRTAATRRRSWPTTANGCTATRSAHARSSMRASPSLRRRRRPLRCSSATPRTPRYPPRAKASRRRCSTPLSSSACGAPTGTPPAAPSSSPRSTRARARSRPTARRCTRPVRGWRAIGGRGSTWCSWAAVGSTSRCTSACRSCSTRLCTLASTRQAVRTSRRGSLSSGRRKALWLLLLCWPCCCRGYFCRSSLLRRRYWWPPLAARCWHSARASSALPTHITLSAPARTWYSPSSAPRVRTTPRRRRSPAPLPPPRTSARWSWRCCWWRTLRSGCCSAWPVTRRTRSPISARSATLRSPPRPPSDAC